MKFVTFLYQNKLTPGIVKDEGYYSFDALLGADAPKTLLDYIQQYENKPAPDFDSLISEKGLTPLAEGDVTISTPIPNPTRDVICIGKNYADHAVEVAETMQKGEGHSVIPEYGVYFAKSAYPPSAHGETLPIYADITEKLDYEAELAVIIGKTALNVKAEDAHKYIFGYAPANDVTVRDRQINHQQWYLGKSFDQTCPIGPAITSADEIEFPPALDITTHVNGELRQSSNTSLLIFGVAKMIEDLSQGMTLRPGDIILTGTAAGVGHAMTPPTYLKAGDVVDVYIEKLGTLTNKFN